eukprot:5431222-Prymnesium_polylepis.1
MRPAATARPRRARRRRAQRSTMRPRRRATRWRSRRAAVARARCCTSTSPKCPTPRRESAVYPTEGGLERRTSSLLWFRRSLLDLNEVRGRMVYKRACPVTTLGAFDRRGLRGRGLGGGAARADRRLPRKDQFGWRSACRGSPTSTTGVRSACPCDHGRFPGAAGCAGCTRACGGSCRSETAVDVFLSGSNGELLTPFMCFGCGFVCYAIV